MEEVNMLIPLIPLTRLQMRKHWSILQESYINISIQIRILICFEKEQSLVLQWYLILIQFLIPYLILFQQQNLKEERIVFQRENLLHFRSSHKNIIINSEIKGRIINIYNIKLIIENKCKQIQQMEEVKKVGVQYYYSSEKAQLN